MDYSIPRQIERHTSPLCSHLIFFSSRSRIMVKQNTVCFTYHAINQRYHHFNGCLNEKRDYCDEKNIKKNFKRKKVNVELSYLYITNFKVKTRMKYT